MTAGDSDQPGRRAPVAAAGLFFCLLLIGITASVFLARPELDLIVQSYFYRPETRFFLAKTFFADIFYVGIRELGMIIGTFLIAVAVYAACARVRPLGRHWRAFVLFTLVFICGPGIVVNVIFKDNWGRARPDYVVEFGGTKKFTPPLVITDQCKRNCSFVAGHPSVLFAGFALVLVMRRRRALGYAAVIALGGLAGLGRIMEGGHFLSDVIFAGLFVYLVAWLWHFLLYRWKLPERFARCRPGRWVVRQFVEHRWHHRAAVRFMRSQPGL
ncbi:MAG: phosphatase PAP2 family protein, partial [Alphaproteobacteria bacterium]